MIKLTMIKGSAVVERAFDKDAVVIGSGTEEIRGTPLENSELEPKHVSFITEGESLVVVNHAKDPFVTLNELPFGKKKIRESDTIQIDDVEIHASITTSDDAPISQPTQTTESSKPKPSEKPKEPLRPAARSTTQHQEKDVLRLLAEVEDLTKRTQNITRNLTPKQEPNPEPKTEPKVAQEPISHSSIQEKPKVIPPIAEEVEQAPKITSHAPSTVTVEKKTEFRRERQEPEDSPPIFQSEPSFFSRWRSLVAATSFVLLVGLSAMGVFYFTYSERNDAQEYLAARELSDVAMALSYAKAHETATPNQNWSNKNFLLDNLESILGENEPLPEITPQGKFKDLPYQLRVYTGIDGFLVLAQPMPSFWQWSIPKDTIVIDSRLMDLRKITDLKQLNRMLAQANPLTGENSEMILSFLEHAETIPLKRLAKELGMKDFRPIRELVEVNPSGINLLYNAPRYHRLTGSMVKAAKEIAASTGSESVRLHAMKQLLNEKQKLSALNGLVVYSTLPENETAEVAQVIHSYFPDEEIVLGQLAFDGDGSEILSSHLVAYVEQEEAACDEESESCEIYDFEKEENFDEFAPREELDEQAQLEEKLETLLEEEVFAEEGVEFARQLQHLAQERQEALGATARELVNTIEQHTQAPIPDFKERMMALQRKFEDLDLQEQSYLQFAIVEVYQSHVQDLQEITHDEFITAAAELGLESFVPPSEFEQEKWVNEDPIEEPPVQSADVLISNVRQAPSLVDLNWAVAEGKDWLDNNGDEIIGEEWIRTHNQLQIEALRTLENILFTSDKLAQPDIFSPETRSYLVNVLDLLNLDEQQRIYYLSEFDWAIEELRSSLPRLRNVAED